MTNKIVTQIDKKSISGIRIIPELNIAALNQHKDKELMLWYCLRSMDITGCGHIPLLKAEKLIIQEFNYSRATFYRHLRLGMGKLWEVYENRRTVIKIYCASKAYEWFNTFKPSRYIDIDIDTLLEHPRKALLWNTGAYRPQWTGRVNHPISRQSLEDKTKIDERTQQRYDSRVKTERQVTMVKTRDPASYKLYCQMIPVKIRGKEIMIKRQLGNIYYSHGYQSSRGLLKKAAGMAKERQESLTSAEASNKGLMPSKRFYSRFQGWLNLYIRGKVTDEDSYYPTKNKPGVYVQCIEN